MIIYWLNAFWSHFIDDSFITFDKLARDALNAIKISSFAIIENKFSIWALTAFFIDFPNLKIGVSIIDLNLSSYKKWQFISVSLL